ncbi:MAG: SAM-dependent methyltransferase [Proteobacteria bacterium]|nr:MAG: SAM-dependent methyltransferase [Pseudomonadota bacterium]
MSLRSIGLDDRLYDYLLDNSLREHPVLRRLREETAALPESNMQIAPEQGQFMALLLRLMGARTGIEIGVFTGYSTLCCALALPEDGRIVACDLSEEWTTTARRYWREAGVEGRIDLRMAPALETLAGLLAEGYGASFDYAFIDADKEQYCPYYEACLCLIRTGGLILIDNVLWNGSVADPSNQERDTIAIRQLNSHLKSDERIDLSVVAIGDGLTLARKR